MVVPELALAVGVDLVNRPGIGDCSRAREMATEGWGELA
jgi:hypothetical protein